MKKFLTVFLVIIPLLFSCTNLAHSIKEEGKTYKISGRIIQGSEKGAVPSARSLAPRTAVPSLPQASELTFEAELTEADNKTGSCDIDGTDLTLTVPAGSWTLTINAYTDLSKTKLLYEGKTEFRVLDNKLLDKSGAEITSLQVRLALKTQSGGTGSVRLPVQVSGSLAKKYKVIYDGVAGSLTDLSGTGFTIEKSSQAPGKHTLALEFYSSAGTICYAMEEVINVIADFETDTFISSGEYISSGKISITDTQCRSFVSETLFVEDGGDGSDTNSGSFFAPLATIGKALELIDLVNDGTKTYKIVLFSNFTDNIRIDRTSSDKKLNLVFDCYGGQWDITAKDPGSVVFYLKSESTDKLNVTFKNICLTGSTGPGGGNKFGGGIYAVGVNVTLDAGTDITGNKAYEAGGIFAENCNVTINNASFTNNTVSKSGGGAYFNQCPKVTVTGCEITGNRSLWDTRATEGDDQVYSAGGGGIYISGCPDVTFTGTDATPVLFSNNKIGSDTVTSGMGGALRITSNSKVTCSGNVTFSGNEAYIGGAITTYGPLILDGTKILYNKSDGNGAAIRQETKDKSISLKDVTVAGNKHTVADQKGTGVYVLWGTLELSGAINFSHSAEDTNDILVQSSTGYLSEDSNVKITGDLTGDAPVAVISLAGDSLYTTPNRWLITSDSVNLSENIKKLSLKNTNYEITETGYIRKKGAKLSSMSAAPVTAGTYSVTDSADIEKLAEWINAGSCASTDFVFKLTDNVDMTGVNHTKIGSPDNKFEAVLDGNGKTISNLTLNATEAYTGFIGSIGHGEVKDLNFESVKLTSGSYLSLGTVTGHLFSGKISNCSVSVKEISGANNTGGICGFMAGGIIEGCSVKADGSGTISGKEYTGGIAGYTAAGVIINSYNTVNITATNGNCGGITGQLNSSGKIINCYNTGNINSAGMSYVAGIVGSNASQIFNCVSTGKVYASSPLGLIAAQMYASSGTAYNCYGLTGGSAGEIVGLTSGASHGNDQLGCKHIQSGGLSFNAAPDGIYKLDGNSAGTVDSTDLIEVLNVWITKNDGSYTSGSGEIPYKTWKASGTSFEFVN